MRVKEKLTTWFAPARALGTRVWNSLTEGTTRTDRLKIVYMPVILLLLTVSLGTVIGVWFQNRSFRHNELFRAKLDRVLAAQKEVVDIMGQVDLARKQIRSNEDFIRNEIRKRPNEAEAQEARQYYGENGQMGPSLVILKETLIRLEALADYSTTLGHDSGVTTSIEKYHDKVTTFIKCVENNTSFSVSCSDEHPDIMESLREVLKAHSKLADDLINSYE